VAALQRLVAAEAAEQRIVLDLQEVQLVDHDTCAFWWGAQRTACSSSIARPISASGWRESRSAVTASSVVRTHSGPGVG